ncbi:hypothetical protein Tco_0481428 [Tanacetum coccineum]
MSDLNITMEEYIRLEEEKARKRGKVFNWETAKYGKIWYDEDVLDLRSVETKFPAIVFNDSLTSNETPSCEPKVSSNDEIDFRISFDESDDEDYTPTVSCINDLNFFKEFENEFPAIVYNDALTSKSNFSNEPTLCPQHIDEFDLKDETSLSEYDEKEQNILYFNDPFPFNIVYPDNQKSDKGNDENEIDMIQSSGGNENTNKLLEESHDKIRKNLYMPFGIPFDPKRYYKDGDCARMLRSPRYGPSATRSETPMASLSGLTLDMRRDLAERMGMVYTGDDGQELFVSHAWRRLFRIRAPLVQEFILEFFSTCKIGDEMRLDVAGLHIAEEMAEDRFGAYWLGSERLIPDKGDLSDYWVEISSGKDFLRGVPSYTYIRDPVRRLCHRLISYSISKRGQAPEKHAEGRKSRARLSRGHFIGRLAHHFGLVSDDGLRGLSVVASSRLERQHVIAAGAPGAAKDAPAVDEGVQADPAPMQAPQQPPPPPPAAGSGVGVDTTYLRHRYAVSSLMDMAYWSSEY